MEKAAGIPNDTGGQVSGTLARSATHRLATCEGHVEKYRAARVRRLDRGVAFSHDQHTDYKQIENVGADANGERGRIKS